MREAARHCEQLRLVRDIPGLGGRQRGYRVRLGLIRRRMPPALSPTAERSGYGDAVWWLTDRLRPLVALLAVAVIAGSVVETYAQQQQDPPPRRQQQKPAAKRRRSRQPRRTRRRQRPRNLRSPPGPRGCRRRRSASARWRSCFMVDRRPRRCCCSRMPTSDASLVDGQVDDDLHRLRGAGLRPHQARHKFR